MNLKAVERHFDKLTPEERMALTLAAGIRGDEQEQERLRASAPPLLLKVGTHYPYQQAFITMSMFYVLYQLDACLSLITILGFSDRVRFLAEGGEEPAGEQEPPGILQSIEILAYLIRLRRQAWLTFCDQRGIAADEALQGIPGLDHVAMAVEVAEAFTITEERYTAWCEERGGQPYTLAHELANIEGAYYYAARTAGA